MYSWKMWMDKTHFNKEAQRKFGSNLWWCWTIISRICLNKTFPRIYFWKFGMIFWEKMFFYIFCGMYGGRAGLVYEVGIVALLLIWLQAAWLSARWFMTTHTQQHWTSSLDCHERVKAKFAMSEVSDLYWAPWSFIESPGLMLSCSSTSPLIMATACLSSKVWFAISRAA